VIVNVAVAEPAFTVTDVGKESALVSPLIATLAFAGVLLLNVTVHVVLLPCRKLVVAHCSALTVTGISERLAVWELPFRLAVTVAD
jgi:hypothetical protein